MFNKVPLPTSLALRSYYGCSYLTDAKIGESIVNKLNLNKLYDDKLKILDTYSNNLLFSTLLYNNLKPSQHFLMEERKDYVKHTTQYLESIKNIPNNFHFLNLDPFNWKSYLDITENDPILKPGYQSRDHMHTEFLFVGSLHDEGLLMQWLACLGHQNWIVRFGNVRMLLWVPEASAIKVTAPSASPARAKCSIVAQTFADCKLIAVQDQGKLKKFSENVLVNDAPLIVSSDGFSGSVPMSLIEISPKDVHINDIYSWDYVTKNLMISKTLPLSEAVRNLGPGAEEYFSQHLPKVMLKTKIKELLPTDFTEITTVFDNWAFKPDSLFDFLVQDRGN